MYFNSGTSHPTLKTPQLTAACTCAAGPAHSVLWDTQEQLEDVQGEVARLSMQLAGAHKACELLGSVALNAELQRMQETAALSAHINELSNQVLAMHQQGTWVCFTLVIPCRDAWVPHCLPTICYFPTLGHAQFTADMRALANAHIIQPFYSSYCPAQRRSSVLCVRGRDRAWGAALLRRAHYFCAELGIMKNETVV